MAARKRTDRRTKDRETEKLLVARTKLAALEPGGSPERPEVVQSASVIEPHAESRPCYACGSGTRVEEHRAEAGLRVVAVRCKACGRTRSLYFQLASRTLN